MTDTSERTLLAQEWTSLQHAHEDYERSALWIKLAAVFVLAAGVALGVHELLIGVVLIVLWVQEGIYRTFQARLGERLQEVERLLRHGEPPEGSALQLHSNWLAQRSATNDLIGEYAASIRRPTVAFPHVPLLAIDVLVWLFYTVTG